MRSQYKWTGVDHMIGCDTHIRAGLGYAKHALFIGQTYIDVSFITDKGCRIGELTLGDEGIVLV